MTQKNMLTAIAVILLCILAIAALQIHERKRSHTAGEKIGEAVDEVQNKIAN